MSDTTTYKDQRLEKQITWHSEKARHNKRRFRLYQIITLLGSAVIPIVNVTDFANIPIVNVTDFANLLTRLLSSVIGGIIVVATGITQLEKYQENWILYRTSAELLKKEKYFFENCAGDYSGLNDNEKKKLLVERVESIVSSETSKYFTIHQPQKPRKEEDKR
jgi:Protein of unknown function (DUF4231)